MPEGQKESPLLLVGYLWTVFVHSGWIWVNRKLLCSHLSFTGWSEEIKSPSWTTMRSEALLLLYFTLLHFAEAVFPEDSEPISISHGNREYERQENYTKISFPPAPSHALLVSEIYSALLNRVDSFWVHWRLWALKGIALVRIALLKIWGFGKPVFLPIKSPQQSRDWSNSAKEIIGLFFPCSFLFKLMFSKIVTFSPNGSACWTSKHSFP